MPSKYITPLAPLIAGVAISAWLAWEFAVAIFRTVILGQGADEQTRDNLNDE